MTSLAPPIAQPHDGPSPVENRPAAAAWDPGLRLRPAPGPLTHVARFIRRKPLGAFGGLLVLVLLVAALFAGQIAPYAYDAGQGADRLQGPSLRHLLGTDNLGRDMFSRVVWGARISVTVGFGAVVIGTGLAAVLNAVRFNQIPSNSGLGLEMKVIAAVVVGGTAITGGRGTFTGTLLGVLLLGAIGPGLTFLGVSAYWERAFHGAIILGAVAIDATRARHATRSLSPVVVHA